MRDAWRSLKSTPAVSAFIIGVLTLGIAAATVTFSVVDTVVLRPLPFPDPDRLAVIQTRSSATATFAATSAFMYHRFGEGVPAFASLAATRRGQEPLKTAAEPELILSARVTANLFEVLGVHPMLGQPFNATHEIAGNDMVAIIGYDLWQRRFGGDMSVVGQSVPLERGTLTILGVMPRGFSYPIDDDRRPEIWTPYVVPAAERSGRQLSSYLQVVGRLAPGATLEMAQAQAEATVASTVVPGPGSITGLVVETASLTDVLLGDVRRWMLLVLGAVVLVLLVACSNVANLLLTRATRRARELSIRSSLGASRRNLVTTMLVESLTLSLVAAGLGIAIAYFGVEAARKALPTGIVRASSIAFDWRVFLAAVTAAIVTGLLFGAVPAWLSSRHNLVSFLKQSGTQSTIAGTRWRSAFLIAQVAFVALLLVATALFVSSFVHVTTKDLGFERRNLLTASRSGLTSPVVEAIRTIESLPGVTAVGAYFNGSAPLAVAGGFGGGGSGTQVGAPGTPPEQRLSVRFIRTAPGYFRAAAISIIEGRDFQMDEIGRDDRVVIDVLTARGLFGSRSPIGAAMVYGSNTPATVIGVVAAVFDRGPETEPNAMIYMPMRPKIGGPAWLVRTAGDPMAVKPAIEAALNGMADPADPPALARPLEDAFRVITAERRFVAGLMSVFGSFALVIGAAGIYGVMLAIVVQQTREFGIRLALGATSWTILSNVIRGAARLLLIGLAIGLPLGFALSLTMASVFFDVKPTDLSTYAMVAGLTLLAGVLAAFLPARRAARVDPQVTLRAE
jgi:predicted permease